LSINDITLVKLKISVKNLNTHARARTHARTHARIHWMSHFTLPSKYLKKDEFHEKITTNKTFMALRSNLMD